MRAELNQGLIDFLKASPTPFHATASLARRLEAAGYRRFDERDAWHTEAGGRYYATRNDSSLIAIRLGRRSPLESGFRLVGAHTDSPCLRVKPNPEIARNGFLQLGVEVYGGALFAPWFDRDLSLAGRVTFRANGKLESRLVDFRKAIAVIPNLAIHLNRAANEGWPINAQNELPPIIAQLAPGEAADFRLLLDEQLLREHGITADVVLDYELSFYDTQSAAVVGLNDEFIAGARLDNLLSATPAWKLCSTPKATRTASWSAPTTRKSVPVRIAAPTARSSNRYCAACCRKATPSAGRSSARCWSRPTTPMAYTRTTPTSTTPIMARR